MRPLVSALAAAGLLAAVVTGCSAAAGSPASAGHRAPPPATYYLALGDSLSQGVQPDAAGVSEPTQDGYANQLYATLHRSQPGLRLFPTADDWKYIRMVYLVRESVADHDMAIIAAARPETLDGLTEAVILHASCKSDETASCMWVPKGVAVDAEK